MHKRETEVSRSAPVPYILKLLAPYIGVGIFWCIFRNGWLSILAYHAQILLWSLVPDPGRRRLSWRMTRMTLLALPTILAGPILYILLPHITSMELGAWFTEYNIPKWSVALLIPYFGILHPILEQLHWAPLREQSAISHAVFAGYHMMVLYSILPAPWLAASFVILAGVSVVWRMMAKQSGSLTAPVLSHILADLGFVTVAWLIM